MRLQSEAQLVATAPNPCMDLVALLLRERAPARTGPSGLTPAQLAMRQRMLAIQARRMGNAHAAAAPSGVERGPALKLVLWRTGSSDDALWEAPIVAPDFGADAPHGAGAKETLAVTSLVWSPDGERIAVTLDATRDGAHAAALVIYSVYDGAVHHTRRLDTELDPCSALWLPYTPPAVPSQALDMLRALAPLAVIADAPPDTRVARVGRTQERPSVSIAQGKGPLAHVPSLPIDPCALGWVRRAAAGGARSAEAASLLLVATPSHTHVFLDGTISLGSVRCGGTLVGGDAAQVVLLDALAPRVLHLALAGDAVAKMAQLSTALHAHLAYASDAAHGARAAWLSTARPKAAEWRHHIYDVSKRHASDVRAELQLILLTGCTSPASEQLLLHNMTEGITLAMEREARHGLKTIRRLAGTGVLPACERILVILQELRGCALWRERFPALAEHVEAVRELEASAETCVAVALALVEHAEMELLALDEFFKWWRMEQDRQEKIKLGDEAPRPVPCHDTLTVLEFLQRGFISPELDALLGRPEPRPQRADESEDSDSDVPDESVVSVAYEGQRDAGAASAVAAAEETLAWLASPQSREPSADQVRGVFAQRQLFVTAAQDYHGDATLPGDRLTICERIDAAARAVAHVLEPAFSSVAHGAHVESAPAPPQSSVRTRDVAMRSVPAGAARSAESLLLRRAAPSARTAVLFHGAHGLLFVRVPPDAPPVGALIEFAEEVVDAAFANPDELIVLCRADGDVLRGVSLVPLEFEPLSAEMRTQTSAPTFEVPVAQYASDSDGAYLLTDALVPSAISVHAGRRVTLLGGRGQTLVFVATV